MGEPALIKYALPIISMPMHLAQDMKEQKKRNSVPSENGGQRDIREEGECDQPPPETARDVPAMLNSLHPSRFPVGIGAAWRIARHSQCGSRPPPHVRAENSI